LIGWAQWSKINIMMDGLSHSIPAPWVRLGAPIKMGLQSCAPEDWLLAPDAFGDDTVLSRHVALKEVLAAQHHDAIFQAFPEADDAAEELLALITENLKTHHQMTLPQADQLHPLDHAARYVPEDLLLLAPEQSHNNNSETGQWVLKAGSLTFPSHWVLAEKMGLPMAGIHAPVPHYGEKLARPVDRFFDAMLTGPISLRRNWTLQEGDELYAPSRHKHSPFTVDDIGRRLHVRVERQTLRKLPKSGWIVFTIQTAIAPINRWEKDAEALGALLDVIDVMTPAMLEYRGAHHYTDVLKSWVKQAG